MSGQAPRNNQMKTVAAPEAQYDDQRSFGVVTGKTHVEIAPKHGGVFLAGNTIRLELPGQAWMDPSEFFISFRTSICAGKENSAGVSENDFNVLPYQTPSAFHPSHPSEPNSTRPGDKTVQFVPGIQSIFSRVKLLAGSVVLEDINDYPTLYRMLMESTTTEKWRDSDGFLTEGYWDPSNTDQRLSNANFHSTPPGVPVNPGHTYTIRPLLGLFNAGKYLPLKLMGQLTIELHLEQNKECLWSTSSAWTGNSWANPAVPRQVWPFVSAAGIPDKEIATDVSEHLGFTDSSRAAADFPNASYRVEDVRMHVPFIYPREDFEDSVAAAIEKGGLRLFHSSYASHIKSVTSTARVNLSFQERALSIKGVYVAMRNSPSIGNIRSDFCFPANGISSYQFKVGAEYFPAQPVNCKDGGGEALAQLKQSLGTFGSRALVSHIKESNFLPVDSPHQLDTGNESELNRRCSEPSKFMMGLQLERNPGQSSGFNSAATSVDIELIMDLSSQGDVVGTHNADYKFRGAISDSKFQPTKVLVSSPATIYWDQGNRAPKRLSAKHGPWYPKDIVSNTAAADRYVNYFDNKPEGMMNALNVKTTYTPLPGDDANSPFAKEKLSYSRIDAGMYARVYAFMHVDQVLVIQGVGRMEILR